MIVSTAALSGCQTGREQAQARRELERELAERRERTAKANTLYRQGVALYEQARLDPARQKLDEAVRIDPRHAQAWMALGVVEFERNRLFDSAQAFERVVQLRPTRYEPHYNLGQIFESIGRYPRAIQSYERALELAPDRVEVMENLARCYIATGKNLDEARELLDRTLSMETRPEWQQWLREQRRLLERTTPASE